MIIISAGFQEGGAEDARLEKEMTQRAGIFGTWTIGPKGLGLIDTDRNLQASSAADMPGRGSISFIEALFGGARFMTAAKKASSN